MLGNFSCGLFSDFFFKIFFFEKNISDIPSECQTVWIQVRTDILLGLIWVQTVCKGYKQTKLVDEEIKKGGIVLILFVLML